MIYRYFFWLFFLFTAIFLVYSVEAIQPYIRYDASGYCDDTWTSYCRPDLNGNHWCCPDHYWDGCCGVRTEGLDDVCAVSRIQLYGYTQTSGASFRQNICPDWDVEDMLCYIYYYDTQTRIKSGYWDRSERKCVECSSGTETKIYGDLSGIYRSGNSGDAQCERGCPGYPDICDELSPSSYTGKCSNNKEIFCSSTCTALEGTCENDFSGCNAIEQCDEKYPGALLAYCNIVSPSYFQDQCSSNCLGEDRENNICRSAGSLGSGDGCTAAAACNGIVAGTGVCSSSCTTSTTSTSISSTTSTASTTSTTTSISTSTTTSTSTSSSTTVPTTSTSTSTSTSSTTSSVSTSTSTSSTTTSTIGPCNPCPSDNCPITCGETKTGTISGAGTNANHFFNLILSATRIVTITLTPQTSDYDLFTRWDAQCPPSGWVCRPYEKGTTPETCSNTLSADTYIIMVNQYSGAGSYSLSVSCQSVGGTSPITTSARGGGGGSGCMPWECRAMMWGLTTEDLGLIVIVASIGTIVLIFSVLKFVAKKI